MWNARPASTVATYQPRLTRNPKPNRAVMVKIRHATPMGANFMTMSITLATASKMPLNSAITGAALAGVSRVKAAPKTMEKNIRPIMSGVDRAIDSIGLAGTSILTNDRTGDSAADGVVAAIPA